MVKAGSGRYIVHAQPSGPLLARLIEDTQTGTLLAVFPPWYVS
jgi:hypothetical protein